MLGPEIEINEDEATAIARGLLAVARCDGTFDPREKELIESILPMPTEGLTDIAPDDLARALRGDAARVFLQSCFLVAFADRQFTDPERALIGRYASALEVSAEEVVHIAQGVKEYLLGSLAHLSNLAPVAEEAEKLSF
jgi:tellurite resistance protein